MWPTEDASPLVVLGASGGCGQWVVRLATERGWPVRVLVRDEAIARFHSGVEVHVGDPGDVRVLDEVMGGARAVAMCLGLRRDGRSPWARLRSPIDLTQRVAERLREVLPWHGIGRVVAISAGGVGDSITSLSAPVRRLVRTANVGVAYADLERMEAVLAASELDWAAVRPVTLVQGAPTGRVAEVQRYRLLSTIRRGDVASHMLALLATSEPIRGRTPLIATATATASGRGT